MKVLTNSVTRLAAASLAGLLLLMPFHALLSVWVGTSLHAYDAVRLWKEVVLVVLALAAAWILYKDRVVWRAMRRSPLFWLMGAYVLLHVVLGIWAWAAHRVTFEALSYGLGLNLRLVVVFFVAWVLGTRVAWLRRAWPLYVVVPALLVVGFGLLQAAVLPHDFLSHVGYGSDTIAAYQTVDQKSDYIRLQSTLRGANPLGAYLVVVITALLGIIVSRKPRTRHKLALATLLLAATVVLGLTYSRSAYIGTIIALLVVVWLLIKTERGRQTFIIAGTFAFVTVGLMFSLFRDDNTFQNIFFHTDETSLSQNSSNASRLQAQEQTLRDIWQRPLGRGPGASGPASAYNTAHATRIADNYYLQIAQEVGWLGLAVFLAVIVQLLRALWQRRTQLLPLILFASLVGLSVINLLSHAWTDDTLAYVWWALAGIALAQPAILTRDEMH